MNSRLNYGQLTAILRRLGFRDRIVKDSHVLFTHKATETIVMLPIARETEKVPTRNMVSTRFIVDMKGIANRDRWEKLVREELVM